MKTFPILLIAFILQSALVHAQPRPPVSPDASKEAKALLELYYSISGKFTLTGQHNYPSTGDKNSKFAKKYTGQTPVIWSCDMGFAAAGDYDSYLARPEIVKEAIRQHKKGSIITLCWHAVPPTSDEPVTFQPRRKVSPDSLESVQGQLPDEQFRELLTPGTRLYNRWARQVDSIAVYLKQLQDAGVPVLWRPYHEMNGDWFWWGGRIGELSSAALYRQIFDRLVNYHKLNNLIWVWNVDRPSTPVRKFSNFYPGDEYLDILSVDVYGSDFNQAYYDSLIALSHGKPLIFGEVGNPPSPEILKDQPLWASWVIWAGMVKNTTRAQYDILLNDARLISKEDESYFRIINPFREASGMPDLPLKSRYPADFTGEWLLNETESTTGPNGTTNLPYKLLVDQEEDELIVKKYVTVEWDADRESEEDYKLSGTEMKSMVRNNPRISTVSWEKSPASMTITTSWTFKRGDQNIDMKSTENWSIDPSGKKLTIVQKSKDQRGGKLGYDRIM
jgi:mannan endo-1,4-beta-mannosidase